VSKINSIYTLKQARMLSNKTQFDIAKALGISLCTVRKYERNPEKMSIEKAKRFCEIVKQPFDKIFMI
jgi:DNA-binding XRE family transcriptional regulator